MFHHIAAAYCMVSSNDEQATAMPTGNDTCGLTIPAAGDDLNHTGAAAHATYLHINSMHINKVAFIQHFSTSTWCRTLVQMPWNHPSWHHFFQSPIFSQTNTLHVLWGAWTISFSHGDGWVGLQHHSWADTLL